MLTLINSLLILSIIGNALVIAFLAYFFDTLFKRIQTIRKITYRLEKRISDRSFQFFYMLSAKKINNLIIHFYLLVFFCQVAMAITCIYLGHYFSSLHRVEFLLYVLGIALIVLTVLQMSTYWMIQPEIIDRIKLNPKLINHEIRNLKNYRWRGLSWSAGNSFIKSINFLSTVAGKDLKNKYVKLKVLTRIYKILVFFSRILDSLNDASELEVKRCVSSRQGAPLSLMEVLAQFDRILAGCKIETKIIKLCRYTLLRKRLRPNG